MCGFDPLHRQFFAENHPASLRGGAIFEGPFRPFFVGSPELFDFTRITISWDGAGQRRPLKGKRLRRYFAMKAWESGSGAEAGAAAAARRAARISRAFGRFCHFTKSQAPPT